MSHMWNEGSTVAFAIFFMNSIAACDDALNHVALCIMIMMTIHT